MAQQLNEEIMNLRMMEQALGMNQRYNLNIDLDLRNAVNYVIKQSTLVPLQTQSQNQSGISKQHLQPRSQILQYFDQSIQNLDDIRNSQFPVKAGNIENCQASKKASLISSQANQYLNQNEQLQQKQADLLRQSQHNIELINQRVNNTEIFTKSRADVNETQNLYKKFLKQNKFTPEPFDYEMPPSVTITKPMLVQPRQQKELQNDMDDIQSSVNQQKIQHQTQLDASQHLLDSVDKFSQAVQEQAKTTGNALQAYRKQLAQNAKSAAPASDSNLNRDTQLQSGNEVARKAAVIKLSRTGAVQQNGPVQNETNSELCNADQPKVKSEKAVFSKILPGVYQVVQQQLIMDESNPGSQQLKQRRGSEISAKIKHSSSPQSQTHSEQKSKTKMFPQSQDEIELSDDIFQVDSQYVHFV